LLSTSINALGPHPQRFSLRDSLRSPCARAEGSRGGPRARLAEYREALFDKEYLIFRYHVLALARLKAEEYVGSGALGAALSALMGRASNSDLAGLRFSMLKRVAESSLDEVVKYLLVNVIETYFELSIEDAEEYRRLLARKENRAVQDLELTWADKLIEKGRMEGREAGVLEGKREAVSRLLNARFGPLSEDVMKKIAATGSLTELDTYLDRILSAKSLQEIGFTE
jgi:hypothetical protein